MGGVEVQEMENSDLARFSRDPARGGKWWRRLVVDW